MKLERLMDIIAKFSIIYILYSYIFIEIKDPNSVEVEFIIVCLVTFISISFFKEKKLLKFLMVLAELIPIIFIRDNYFIIITAVSAIYSLYYLFRPAPELNYDNCIKVIKKGLIMIVLLIILTVVLVTSGQIDSGIYIQNCGLYAILFMIDSLLLLRILRYYSFDRNRRKINKINISLTAVIVALATGLSIKAVRMGILNLIHKFLHGLDWIFCCIISGYLYLLNKIVGTSSLPEDVDMRKDPSAGDGGNGGTVIYNRITKIKESPSFSTVSMIFKIIIVLFAIFIIVIILKHKKNPKVYTYADDYTEEKRIKNKSDSLWSRFKPRTYADRIRAYYSDFLKLGKAKGIKFKNSDTTLDINKKTESSFDKTITDKFRKLYIKVRYSDYRANRDDVRKAANFYKEMKLNEK